MLMTKWRSAGKEADVNARVWRLNQDRMSEMDDDTIKAWNDSINFLLVFVSLKMDFSAVAKFHAGRFILCHADGLCHREVSQ